MVSQISVLSIPVSTCDATVASIVAVVAVVGAVRGALAGVRFRRRVDRAGLGG